MQKLASQTMVYGVSAILSKFLNYMLSPYLTRIMSETVYGDVNVFYAIIPFCNVLLTMGLATGYFRYASRCENNFQRKELFTTTWGAVGSVSLLFLALTFLFGPGLARTMNYSWDLVLITGLLITIDNIAAIPLASLRQEGRAVYYTVVNVTGVVVNITACVLLYTYVPNAVSNPVWVLVANLIASSVSLLMLLPNALRKASGFFSLPLLKRIFTYSIPLMMSGIMGVSGDFIDRLLLRYMLPEPMASAQVGVYTAVAKIAALMMIFRQIYTLGAEPFFLQGFSKEDFRRTNAEATKYFTIAGIAIFLLITLFSDQFAYIIGGDFRVGMDVVPMLLLANLFAGLLVNLSFWYKAADKTRLAILITGLGVIATLIVNIALIPSMGYHGAAIARVISMGLMVIVSYFLCMKYFPVPFDLRRIGFYFGLGGAIFALSFFTPRLPEGLHLTVNFLLLLSYAAIAFRTELAGRNINRLWKK